MEFIPHSYQEYCINKIISTPACALFLDMGLGKTVITLTAIQQLIYDYFTVAKVLVIAPKKVAESTWSTEADKWQHLKDLKISKVLGSAQERKTALATKADIYVINRENVVWLCQHYKNKLPFDMLVVDESSSFKSIKAKRFRALRIVRPLFDRVVLLTGTPTGNGLMDLWSQIYLLDQGKRLGRTITEYRNRWFVPDARNAHVVFSYKPILGADKDIYKAIGDISFSMSAKDYLQLPEKVINDIPVELDLKARLKYNELEREKVLELGTSDITAGSAAVLANKLLQLANGTIYDDDKGTVIVHDAKLEALEEIMEAAQGKPVLVFYSYKHDQERILKKFPKARSLKDDNALKEWNAGKIEMLLAHPASAGYGLNLQAGGNIIVWYGLTWSLELYEQANARLYRQGQEHTVVIQRLITKGTMDEAVVRALQSKRLGQEEMLEAVKAKIKEYGGA